MLRTKHKGNIVKSLAGNKPQTLRIYLKHLLVTAFECRNIIFGHKTILCGILAHWEHLVILEFHNFYNVRLYLLLLFVAKNHFTFACR